MAHFVIIPTGGDASRLDKTIVERLGNKGFKLPRGEWLVSFEGTSKQLSDDFGISDGAVGVSAVVLNFSGYFGRAGTDIWEWLSVNEAGR